MVKLKDIAQATNVTVSTVSAALNNRGNLSDETRRQIIGVAREMGYIPNPAARQLRNVPAVDVALIINDTRVHGVYLEIIANFLKYCSTGNLTYRIEFYTNADKEKVLPEVMSGNVARGFIHVGYITPALQDFLDRNPRYPLVSFGEPSRFCIRSAMESGGYRAIEYLAQQGYRKVLFSSSTQKFDYHRQLRLGAERAIADFKLTAVAEDCRQEEIFHRITPEYLARMLDWARRALRSVPRPEAIFCSGAISGRALTMAAAELRLRIPEDLAIVTVGIIGEGGGSHPALTSLEHDFPTMLNEAFLMLERIWSDNAPENMEIRIEPRLCVQESTTENRKTE